MCVVVVLVAQAGRVDPAPAKGGRGSTAPALGAPDHFTLFHPELPTPSSRLMYTLGDDDDDEVASHDDDEVVTHRLGLVVGPAAAAEEGGITTTTTESAVPVIHLPQDKDEKVSFIFFGKEIKILEGHIFVKM